MFVDTFLHNPTNSSALRTRLSALTPLTLFGVSTLVDINTPVIGLSKDRAPIDDAEPIMSKNKTAY